MPLLDLDGSTIGLVNAANVDAGPVTHYTYDPSGNPTASGTANDWPFQYQGMEKEFTDPAQYYYSGSGQFYSPQMVRSLSEVGQTGTQGSGGGPAGSGIAVPSGSGPNIVRNAGIGTGAGDAAFLVTLGLIWGSDASTLGLLTPAAIVGTIVDGLVQLFLDLFGGSDTPPTPRQLLHGRHPLYPDILGVQDGLIPDEKSAGPEQTFGDLQICNKCPNQKRDTPKLSCEQQYIVDMANCLEKNEATVGALGFAAGVGCGIGAYFTGGLDLLGCGGTVARMTVTGGVGILAKCQFAAFDKEMQCVQSETLP